MTGAVLVAAVAAVLAPERVLFVETTRGVVLRSVELPGVGLAIFAAPDGRVMVPLQGEDGTAVVAPAGNVERWPGRVFPLFFADYDRMHVVLPGVLATLSYPERLMLERVPIEGLPGARRAACSNDGALVAVIPAVSGARALLLVAALEGGTVRQVELAGDATHVIVAPSGAFVVVASGDTLAAAVLGEARTRASLRVGGEVRSLCLLPNGRDVIAGLATGAAGELVAMRVDPRAQQPLKERFRTPLGAPAVAVATADEDVAAISGDALVVLIRGGRRIGRQVVVPGARDVAVLPARARSTVPAWTDAQKP